MIEFELSEDFIIFKEEVSNWQEAISKSAKALLNADYITENYIKAMIDSVNENGPYICIAPDIAMPHARPEAGSKKVGFSLLRLNKSVAFSDNPLHQPRLLITLSCKESDMHIKMLQSIVEILSIDDNLDRILEVKDKESIVEIFKGGNNE